MSVILDYYTFVVYANDIEADVDLKASFTRGKILCHRKFAKHFAFTRSTVFVTQKCNIDSLSNKHWQRNI